MLNKIKQMDPNTRSLIVAITATVAINVPVIIYGIKNRKAS